VLSALVGLMAVPRGRRRAFKAGWFERSTQTRRRRSQRRPTHGGLVLAAAIGAGALVGGPSQPVTRASLAALVFGVAAGWRAEQGDGPTWLPLIGRLATAAAVPVLGIRAALTGSDAVDAAITAVGALLVIVGLRRAERIDGLLPLLVTLAAAPLLVVAVRGGDTTAPALAALVGAALAALSYTWPPAAVRLGEIGPTVAGGALAAAAIALSPDVSAPRSMVVPLLALLPIGVAAVVPQWGRRLRNRGIDPRWSIGLVATCAAVAAERLAAGALEPATAAGLGAVPVAVLAVVGLASSAGAEPGEHRARNVALVGLGSLVLLGAAGVAGVLALDARRAMLVGREAATDGLAAAQGGDLERAQVLFADADAAFADASTSLDNPIVRLGELVPGIAPNLRNARTLADVGGDLSSTAVAVAERAGADDLLVVDGRFPVEAARQVSAELTPALDTLRSATARLEAADSPLLLGEVRDGAGAVAERIEEATDSIEVAAEATRLAPALLGADEDRRWMVAVLAPAEQRGAGGLAGDFAELRTSNGDIDLVERLPAATLNAATDRDVQLAALPSIYRERYGGFRPGRFWQNLSATPDVPTFAEAIASSYPLLPTGGPVDGVIVLDPFALAALLELTGPITVPDWPEPITSENAAQILMFDHYDRLTEEQIDSFQGDVIDAVVEGLTSGSLPSFSQIASVLGPQVSGGHLRLWSPESDPQALFERIGADGALGRRPAGSDFIQLVTQNDGENKIDWFTRRTLAYDATFDPATGQVQATATVTVANTAPASGVSDYVIGEVGGPTLPGEHELEVTLYSPHRPVEVTDADGTRLPVTVGQEQGLFSVTVHLEIPAGGEASVVASFDGALLPGTDYELLVGRQPAVVADRVVASVLGAGDWEGPQGDPSVLESTGEAPARLQVTFAR
jgi:UDP-N-acetylmuramyl pentapeptide phosphotransferase/UDP-N-acetylglucosamine-1-phosphate transferase